jgi:hypothetical protein
VFSVNTKNHPGRRVWVSGGTLMVDGYRQTHVRASRSEGRKAALMLSMACGFEVAVRPVIAVVGVTDSKGLLQFWILDRISRQSLGRMNHRELSWASRTSSTSPRDSPGRPSPTSILTADAPRALSEPNEYGRTLAQARAHLRDATALWGLGRVLYRRHDDIASTAVGCPQP